MTTHLIDLRQARTAVPDDVSGLQAYLTQLVGEPFRFARVSYGDELTLHFGDVRPARSPKLKHTYGAYVLGLRASMWLLKAAAKRMALSAGIIGEPGEINLGADFTRISNEELEAAALVQAESRVLSVSPFVVKPVNGFGLQLRFSDGSSLLVHPSPPDADEAGDETLPELADWELASPSGLLSAGPGQVWSFTPTQSNIGIAPVARSDQDRETD